MALNISELLLSTSITLEPLSLPICLFPIFTEGTPKNADSLMPFEELPTKHAELYSKRA